MEQEKLREFLENCCGDCEDGQEMRERINEFKIVPKRQTTGEKYKDKTFYKTTGFVYERIMNFGSNENIKRAVISENFLRNVDNLIRGKQVIHHSHNTGEVVGYAHSFCNFKVRENKNQIRVIAHNLFGFDFFSFLKGLRLGAWRTTNLSIGGKNLTSVNYANISDQVKFIDTVKYFQQSLSTFANSMRDEGKKGVRIERGNVIKKRSKTK